MYHSCSVYRFVMGQKDDMVFNKTKIFFTLPVWDCILLCVFSDTGSCDIALWYLSSSGKVRNVFSTTGASFSGLPPSLRALAKDQSQCGQLVAFDFLHFSCF